ncbi:Hypothetical protein Tpal_188 [Trichococcus palustris]|jgi:uncharacterized membrane protein|uniref:DUF1648 domain-containing protein n=1 Tax=Trichococcus palustris TaxID=140314 RepID=A0A143Y4C6_9LACT|nr:DUF5808 domain-containing protein [Trichococcus palustris]CZQ81363.1 Hypothetical protein Tpal_188 [Trichococcus palustris]SFK62762.1 Uncharacterized membrane protein [Trichococcus palustris]
MLAFSLFMFVLFFILGFVNGITPFYSRKGAPFGVTVPTAHQEDNYIVRLKKEYLYQNIIISILFALPILLFLRLDDLRQAEMISSIYVTAAMLVYLIISFVLYLQKRKKIRAWKKANNIKTEPKMEKIVIDTSYQKDLKVISNGVFVIAQLFIVLVTVGITLYYYDAIPERFPVHWNSANEPDRIVDKSYLSVLMLPVMQLFMIPVLFFSHYSFIKSKQKLSPYLSDLSSKQSKLFRQAWSYYFLVVSILTQLLLSGIHFFSLFFADSGAEWVIGITIPYVIIIMGYSLYLTWKYGQGGEKLFLHEAGELPDDVAEVDEEDYWKWGVWYYNPNDPSIFVEKRFGIGSTMNMARWQAWFFVAGILLFIVLMLLLSFAMD